MSKHTKEGKKTEAEKATASGGTSRAATTPTTREFTQLNGKVSNLLKAEKDAKVYLTAHYLVPLKELDDGEPVHVSDFIMALHDEFPHQDLELEEDNHLTDEQEEEVLDIRFNDFLEEAGEEERDAAADAVAEIYLARNLCAMRRRNARTALYNKSIDDLCSSRVKQFNKIDDDRVKVHVWLISFWMIPSVRLQVEQDPAYKSASQTNFSSAFEIFEICRRLFSDREPERDLRQLNAVDALRKVTMYKPNGFVAFNAEFRNAIETVLNTGTELSDVVLINAYTKGLNNTVFADVKKDMNIPSRKSAYPTNLSEFMFEMEQIQNRFNQDGKSPYDLDSTRILKADVKDAENEKSASSKSGAGAKGKGKGDKTTSSPKCIYCEKNHPGVCWDESAIAKHHEALLEASRASRAKADKEKQAQPGKTTSALKKNHHFVARDRDVLPQLFDTAAASEPTAASILTTRTQGIANNEIDFIFDNAADIGLASDPSLGVNHRATHTTLEGAVPGALIEVNSKLDLLHGLGTALLIGPVNIVSDWEVTGKFDKQYMDDHTIRLTSRDTGKVWDFIRDPPRYGDLKFHCTMDREAYEVLSFYQPRRPRNVEVTADQAKSIDNAAHLHRVMGHPGDHALTAVIQAHPELDATVEGLKLWRSVDGPCSGCVQGKMAAHAKFPSTKPSAELGHYEVGEAAGGDVYYLERKPYSLFIDIESGFICDDSLTGHTLGDLKASIRRLLDVWKAGGRTLKILKYDRESALARAAAYLMEEHGLVLELVAAGQHQPHAEKAIGIIKDRMRAIKAGIKDLYGYDFTLTEKLREDALKCIQRTIKRGETLSPMQKFTGRSPDFSRDFRAELGEIILVERPKRGVARDLSGKAEWAIVSMYSKD